MVCVTFSIVTLKKTNGITAMSLSLSHSSHTVWTLTFPYNSP